MYYIFTKGLPPVFTELVHGTAKKSKKHGTSYLYQRDGDRWLTLRFQGQDMYCSPCHLEDVPEQFRLELLLLT